VKPTVLDQHCREGINPSRPADDFQLAVWAVQAEFDKHQSAVVVGWSRSAVVALNGSSGAARLVLLWSA
jgi:hypothetical protein